MNKPLVVGSVVVLVAAAGFAGWYGLKSQRKEHEVQLLLTDAESVFAAKPPERGEIARVLLRLRAAAAGNDRRIARACAHAEILAGDSRKGVERIEASLGQDRPTPEDSRLLGEGYERLFRLSGDQELGRRSLASYTLAAEGSGVPMDQYRAFRMARRLRNEEAAETLSRKLLDGEDSPEKRRILAGRLVDEKKYDEALEALAQLESSFAGEPELQLDTAQALLQRPGTGPAELERARQALEEAVRLDSFLVEARSALATVYHVLGKMDLRNAHLDWLLKNAADHPLWEQWKALRAAPAGSR